MAGCLAFIAALPEEARGILKTGHWRKIASPGPDAMYECHARNEDAILIVSGMGRACAETSISAIAEKHRPSAVLSIGFAGGLVTGQRAGDMIVARTLAPDIATPSNETIHSNQVLTNESLRILAKSGRRHRAGTCVTAPQIVSRPDDKKQLALRSNALAVDMESYWIGMACRERNTPFLAARAIVDTVERPVPKLAYRFASDTNSNAQWKSALHATIHPGSIPELVKLGNSARKARNSLSAFVSDFLDSWPFSTDKQTNGRI